MAKTNEKDGNKITVKKLIITFLYLMWISGVAAIMTYVLSLFWKYEMSDWQFTTWTIVEWLVFGFGLFCWASLTGFIMFGVPYAWVNYWKKKMAEASTGAVATVKFENHETY